MSICPPATGHVCNAVQCAKSTLQCYNATLCNAVCKIHIRPVFVALLCNQTHCFDMEVSATELLTQTLFLTILWFWCKCSNFKRFHILPTILRWTAAPWTPQIFCNFLRNAVSGPCTTVKTICVIQIVHFCVLFRTLIYTGGCWLKVPSAKYSVQWLQLGPWQ